MIKKIIIIIVIVIVLFLIGLNIFQYFQGKNHSKKIQSYEIGIGLAQNYLKERDKKINKLEETLSVKEFIKLPCDKKNTEYEKLDNKCKDLEEINKEDKIKLINLINLLNNCKMQKDTLLNYGFSIYVMGGIGGIKSYVLNEQQIFDFNLTIGFDVIKYYLNNKIGLIAGIYVTPIQDIEVGIKLGILINIKQK